MFIIMNSIICNKIQIEKIYGFKEKEIQKYLKIYTYIYIYILRGFRKLVITFFPVKDTPKFINQQLKNEIKIVN